MTPSDSLSLDQAVALVTGAGRGIGASIARELASCGAHVVVADIDPTSAAKVSEEISAAGGRAIAQMADVTDRTSVERLFTQVESLLGPVDVVVNNAGVSISSGIRRISDADWEKAIAVNQTGVFLCSQSAAKSMIPRGRGRIINIASRAWLGWFGQFAYASTKGAVVAGTRSLAIEMAKYGITVNCIAPGLIDTPLLRQEGAEVIERLKRAQPSGTLGSPGDIAWAVRFLASGAAGTITGQVLYVCGGKSLYARPSRDR